MRGRGGFSEGRGSGRARTGVESTRFSTERRNSRNRPGPPRTQPWTANRRLARARACPVRVPARQLYARDVGEEHGLLQTRIGQFRLCLINSRACLGVRPGIGSDLRFHRRQPGGTRPSGCLFTWLVAARR